MTELDDPHIVEAVSAARALREELRLPLDRPVDSDLLELTELVLDLPVCILQLPEGIAGAYLPKRGQHFIFLQSTDFPTRQRFTLAHELGHHRLRHRGRIDDDSDIGRDSSDPQEQQANYFASEFLMPIEAASTWLADHCDGSPALRDVVLMAGEFHVSPPAALYRLTKGEFGIDRDTVKMLWNEVKEKKHVELADQLKIGPGADQIARHFEATGEGAGPPRLPTKLSENVRAARAVGFITDQRMREVLRQD